MTEPALLTPDLSKPRSGTITIGDGASAMATPVVYAAIEQTAEQIVQDILTECSNCKGRMLIINSLDLRGLDMQYKNVTKLIKKLTQLAEAEIAKLDKQATLESVNVAFAPLSVALPPLLSLIGLANTVAGYFRSDSSYSSSVVAVTDQTLHLALIRESRKGKLCTINLPSLLKTTDSTILASFAELQAQLAALGQKLVSADNQPKATLAGAKEVYDQSVAIMSKLLDDSKSTAPLTRAVNIEPIIEADCLLFATVLAAVGGARSKESSWKSEFYLSGSCTVQYAVLKADGTPRSIEIVTKVVEVEHKPFEQPNILDSM